MKARRGKNSLTLLGDVITRRTAIGVRTLLPARVVMYNAATQTADVQLQHTTTIGVDDSDIELPPDIVPSCPVYITSSSGGATSIQPPILPNDPGYLIVSDRSLERWRTQGVPVDPASGQCHSLIDGVFHPGGLRAIPDVLVPAANPAALTIESLLIHLGNIAVSPAVKGTELASAINAYVATSTTADSVLAGLAEAWAGAPGAGQVAFAEGFAPWLVQKQLAQSNLITALVGALSAKVFVE